jgi:hypothetical protein
MNLHKSSLQFARGSLESYERVRLWYVLYVCDHQFALAYGRPPMMHEDAAIRNAEKLLTSGLSSKGDHGLVAQVKLFRILASGYFMHGCDPDLELSGQDFERLKEFDISVDQWRLEHQPKETGSVRDSMIPPAANALYYHLARFQLNSVALRGVSASSRDQENTAAATTTPSLDMDWERQEASNIAIMTAMSTAKLIADDNGLQRALIGLPIFVHAMIAVCASFLLKMAVVFGKSDPGSDGSTLHLPKDLARYGLNFHTRTALTNVERLVRVLSQVADNASQRHVVRQVVTGLGELLQRFSPGRDADSFLYSLPRSKETFYISEAALVQRPSGITDVTYQDIPDSEGVIDAAQLDNSNNNAARQQQDPFDLTGDLDWRFDDGFLFGIEIIDSELPFL